MKRKVKVLVLLMVVVSSLVTMASCRKSNGEVPYEYREGDY
ncbi:hypothetical protein [Flagellimonas okinawensis]|uniref:Lipoprotein n=1 Tax=Flagellimonas okinawensis TaxID=3031324 RepID=A0ABT5XIK8_9FLAO|nr:hypothetical protein [[Muricauda] okinawensis]MDF0705722.1 hypothetical protein [[Muricauda] okinawensis]